jgi:protease-4
LIKKTSTKKPVVALVAGWANSCGYMIASAADYIFAHSFSELGCIGVVQELAKYKEVKVTGNVEAKMDVELFTAGQFKAIFNAYKELSDEDRAHIQEGIEKGYQQFLNLVSQNRNLERNEYKNWAEAKIFIAPQALELGLIDEIGTIFEAEAKILELIRQRNPDCVFDNELTTNLLPALQ